VAVSPEEARRELDRRASQVTPEEARAELARRQQSTQPSAAPPLAFGGSAAGLVGGVENALSLGGNLAALLPAGLTGIATGLVPGGKTAAEGVASVLDPVAEFLAPRTPAGQNIAGRLGDAFEPAIQSLRDASQGLAALPTKPLRSLGDFIVASTTGDPENLQEFESKVSELSDVPPIIPAAIETAAFGGPLIGGLRLGAVAKPPPIPTTAELFKSGSQAFQRARVLGEGAKVEGVAKLSDSIATLKNEAGQTIRINKALHPKAHGTRKEILKTLEKESVTFDDLVELRQLAADATAAGGADGFRGLMLKNSLDDYVNGLRGSKTLNEARDLWHRASKASTIEEAIDIAGINAGAFHGAGFENALRNQFRALARRIRKGQERGFTAEEIKLIQRTAAGGPVGNVFRWLGKLAPTGVVSGAASIGGGFAAAGGAGAVGLPLVGGISRRIATKGTKTNAENAALLARAGISGIPTRSRGIVQSPGLLQTNPLLAELLADQARGNQ